MATIEKSESGDDGERKVISIGFPIRTSEPLEKVGEEKKAFSRE